MAVFLQHKAQRFDAAAKISGYAQTIFFAVSYNMRDQALKVN